MSDLPGGAAVTVRAAPALDPLERLALSRAAMRQALQANNAGLTGAPAALLAASGSAAGLFDHPVLAALAQVMRRGWARHPWHLSLKLAGEVATCVLKPAVQRHPVKMALGAAVLGGVAMAVLVNGRGWRWILKPAVVAGLMSQWMRLAAEAQAANPPPADRR